MPVIITFANNNNDNNINNNCPSLFCFSLMIAYYCVAMPRFHCDKHWVRFVCEYLEVRSSRSAEVGGREFNLFWLITI